METTAGAVAIGLVVGWLTLSICCLPKSSWNELNWRALAFAATYWGATISLAWSVTGPSGILPTLAGLLAGAATLAVIRASIEISNRRSFHGE